MVAVHFAAFGCKEGQEGALMAAFAGFKQAYKDAALEGYGKIWAGPVKYNAERAKPYTHVLYMEFDSADRIFKDYGGADTTGGKLHREHGAKLAQHYNELLVADFEAPRLAGNLVHMVCFTVAEGKEGLWEEGANLLIENSKSGTGKLPVDVLHSGGLVGGWNRGLNKVLYMEFANKNDLDTYSPDPTHVKAAHEHLVPSAVMPGGIVVFDFEP